MQHKFIFSFRQIILIAILLAPVYSFSQANKTGITIDSSMVTKPKAIEVLNIIQKIEETNEVLAIADRKNKPNSSVIQIDSLLPIYIQVLKIQKKQTKGNK